MALFVALIAVLILAVVVVLAVFAWVLLAPLIRQGRGDDELERDEARLEATVLFGRPITRVEHQKHEFPEPLLPETVVVRAPEPPPPPVPLEIEIVAAPVASIPVPPVPAAATPEPPKEPPPVADVLVVTADSALSDCQLAILASRGCASRRATTASDAVSQLRVRIPDLMLLDAGGAPDAVPLVAALRAWQATELLPVVLFTPGPDADVARSAAELGVTDIVIDAPRVPGLVERALPYWLAGVGVFNSTLD